MENGAVLDEEKRRYLYRSIYDDSMWLINLVENLLLPHPDGQRLCFSEHPPGASG